MNNVNILPEISDFCYRQTDTDSRLTWTLPQGAIGVSISRKDESGITQIEETSPNIVVEHGLIPTRSYTYTIKTKYPNWQESAGVEHTITPQHVVAPFTIQVKHERDYIFGVYWSRQAHAIPMRILLNNVPVKDAVISDGSAEIDVPPNAYHILSAEVLSRGEWVACINAESIDAHLPIPIDIEATQKQTSDRESGGHGVPQINIPITMKQPIPHGVTKFYYTVRTRDDAKWAARNEVGSGDIHELSLAQYERNGHISTKTSAGHENDSFYITVFTAFDGSNGEIISEPSTATILRPLAANVFWEVKKGGWFGKDKLHIDVEANFAVSEQPRIILCGCKQGQLKSYKDPLAEKLLVVEPEVLYEPVMRYSREYDINGKTQNKRLFLFFDLDRNSTRKINYVARPR